MKPRPPNNNKPAAPAGSSPSNSKKNPNFRERSNTMDKMNNKNQLIPKAIEKAVATAEGGAAAGGKNVSNNNLSQPPSRPKTKEVKGERISDVQVKDTVSSMIDQAIFTAMKFLSESNNSNKKIEQGNNSLEKIEVPAHFTVPAVPFNTTDPQDDMRTSQKGSRSLEVDKSVKGTPLNNNSASNIKNNATSSIEQHGEGSTYSQSFEGPTHSHSVVKNEESYMNDFESSR
jgi:hypothetical protein